MSRSGSLALVLPVLAITGCSAVGVVASSDPAVKLEQAFTLYSQQGRFVVAQRLIAESLETSKQRNDPVGIANAHRAFGFFYSAPTSGPFRVALVPDEFVKYADGMPIRWQLAIDHFREAADYSQRANRADLLSNIHLAMAEVYFGPLAKHDIACEQLDLSREAHRRATADRPAAVVELPAGVRTFDELINRVRERMSCP